MTNNTPMKVLLTFLVLATCSIVSYGQSTFEIKQLGNQYTADQITQTFASADFCGAFFVSKRNTIQLNDGAVVELKSQNEMTSSGTSLPLGCVIADDVVYHAATWSISSEGRLMKGIAAQMTPAEMKVKVIHQ